MKFTITLEEALKGTPRDKALFIAQTYIIPLLTGKKITSTEEERDKVFNTLTEVEPTTKEELEKIKKDTEEFWSYIHFTDRTKDLDLLVSYQCILFSYHKLVFQKNIQLILQEQFTTDKIERFYNKLSKELPEESLEKIREHIDKELYFTSFFATIENKKLVYKVKELSEINKKEIEEFTYRFSEIKSFAQALNLYLQETNTKEFVFLPIPKLQSQAY